MILLEQYIELKIFHEGRLRKYNVIELFQDDDGVSFKIFYDGAYIFTLIPTMSDLLSFELSYYDKAQGTVVDWSLYSKIEASLYSIFLKQPQSWAVSRIAAHFVDFVPQTLYDSGLRQLKLFGIHFEFLYS